jgi:hypothetical protein
MELGSTVNHKMAEGQFAGGIGLLQRYLPHRRREGEMILINA